MTKADVRLVSTGASPGAAALAPAPHLDPLAGLRHALGEAEATRRQAKKTGWGDSQRLGLLAQAYDRASTVIKALSTRTDRPSQVLLGQALYERAFVLRLEAKPDDAIAEFHRSAEVAIRALDPVGALVSRVLADVVDTEDRDRVTVENVKRLRTAAAEMNVLADDPAVIQTGRGDIARRWVNDTAIHLRIAQEKLAARGA